MSFRNLDAWFHPIIDALSVTHLSFDDRWRLALFQPLALLTYLLNWIPCTLHAQASTIYIPVRNGRRLRALLYIPTPKEDVLRPLHLDVHGGAFMGGHPEADFRFCTALRDRLDTIVVSPSYRFAPRHRFPAAIDDIDDVVDWLLKHAEAKLGADMTRFTIGGSSAGGNLALAASIKDTVRDRVKGVVTFYAPIDVSIPPWDKPKPQEFPSRDPMAWLQPLYDAYGRSAREQGHEDDPRSSPSKASWQAVPQRVLMVVPGIDILVAEQTEFEGRVNRECSRNGQHGKVEIMTIEHCFHGWLELPDRIISADSRKLVFDRCISFLQDVNQLS